MASGERDSESRKWASSIRAAPAPAQRPGLKDSASCCRICENTCAGPVDYAASVCERVVQLKPALCVAQLLKTARAFILSAQLGPNTLNSRMGKEQGATAPKMLRHTHTKAIHGHTQEQFRKSAAANQRPDPTCKGTICDAQRSLVSNSVRTPACRCGQR